MRIHAARLSGKPDGPVALQVPPDPDCDVCDGTGSWFDQDRIEPNPCTCTHPDWVAAAQPCQTCLWTVEAFGYEPGRLPWCMVYDYCADDCIDQWVDCPDCIGGLPRVELTYSVDRSHGGGVSHETVQEVSAGVGTIQHVQVVDSHDERIINADSIVVVWVKTGQVILFRGGSNLPITLPPGVAPGDTVAIWTAAAEQEPATRHVDGALGVCDCPDCTEEPTT